MTYHPLSDRLRLEAVVAETLEETDDLATRRCDEPPHHLPHVWKDETGWAMLCDGGPLPPWTVEEFLNG